MITQHVGDCLDILPTLEVGSVQAIVTSPPYYGLRDYGVPPSVWPAVTYAPLAGLPPVVIPAWGGCLGLEPDPLAYVAHLVHVFRLARHALAGDGVAWLNLGDSYARTGGTDKVSSATAQVGSTRNTLSQRGNRDSRAPTSIPDKNLLCIPHRAALALQADGWFLRSDVVWEKPNAMPESVSDRPTRAHEYVFLLSKQPRYSYDADAISERATQPVGVAHLTGQHKRAALQDVRSSKLGANQGSDTRNARSIWRVATTPYRGAHYAPMPLALAERCIRAATRPGDLVLDPFGGSGTTARAALALGRRAALIELSPTYIDLQNERTAVVQMEATL
jgi:DNA modification methylase